MQLSSTRRVRTIHYKILNEASVRPKRKNTVYSVYFTKPAYNILFNTNDLRIILFRQPAGVND